MQTILVGTIGVGVLLFVFLYLEAKARGYRGKMEAFAVSSEEEASARPQDPAAPAAGATSGDLSDAVPRSSLDPGDPAVDDDHVDAGGESMGLRERRLI